MPRNRHLSKFNGGYNICSQPAFRPRIPTEHRNLLDISYGTHHPRALLTAQEQHLNYRSAISLWKTLLTSNTLFCRRWFKITSDTTDAIHCLNPFKNPTERCLFLWFCNHFRRFVASFTRAATRPNKNFKKLNRLQVIR